MQPETEFKTNSSVPIWRRFQRSDRGAVAVIFALAIIPLMVLAGMAVDLSQAYLVKSRLSHSLDAAALAVGSMRSTNPDPTYLAAQFSSFVAANYTDTDIGATHDLTFVDNGGIISVTGKATVDTVFMAIIGINNLTVSASSQIIVETNGLEVVMVLDNSYSMNGSRLSDMKTAAIELISILFGTETAPPLLKVGLVPFSGSVNIGSAMTAYITDPTALDWGTTSWGGCVNARTYPNDVQDTDIATGGLWEPDYWADHDSYNNWIQGSTYYDNPGWSGKSPNKHCSKAITPLTNDRAQLESDINAETAIGYTHINYGAVWAWRVISPSAPFTTGAAYGDPDWNKVAIILTDGDNSSSDSVDTAYGYRSEGLLGSTNGTTVRNTLNDRLLEVCTGMKNDGIIVYTITFGTSVSSATATLMSDCASSADKYYASPDAATLSLAFRAIGAELKNLHISQ